MIVFRLAPPNAPKRCLVCRIHGGYALLEVGTAGDGPVPELEPKRMLRGPPRVERVAERRSEYSTQLFVPQTLAQPSPPN